MDLYQELILEHSKRPHAAGLREPFEAEVHHVNPTCGDEVTLRVHVDGHGPGRRRRATCPTTPGLLDLDGLDLGPRRGGHRRSPSPTRSTTFEAMRAMLTSKGEDPGDEELLGDGVAFAGVARYPARVKCALLGMDGVHRRPAPGRQDAAQHVTETT